MYPLRSRTGFCVAVLAIVFVSLAASATSPTVAAEPAPNARAIEQVMKAQDRHTGRLMALPGVVGTATGLNPAGKPVVKVFLAKAGNPGIPEKLEGVPVVVELTGVFIALGDTTARYRPAPIGVSTGHPAITAGTIGCRVTDGTNVYALSNNHVYADENNANAGDNVLQPGPYDGGVNPDDAIGTLYDFEPIVFSTSANNTMDAAIALSDTTLLDNKTLSDGYGTPSLDVVPASLGQNVQKYGRTTSLTHGYVSDINATVNVGYSSGTARFVDQIIARAYEGKFIKGGDSGSLLVTDPGENPVGLLFAGPRSGRYGIANPIQAVLTRFGVTVDNTPATPVTDIAVTSVVAPDSVAQGDPVNVDVTVENVGNQDVTSDIKVELTVDTDVSIGTQTISGGLNTGASTTLTYSWDTTSASLGDHTLSGEHDFDDDNVTNDSNGTVVTVTEPGVGVTVTLIDPDTMPAGTTGTATITGSGFADGAEVTFENGSGPAPTANVTGVAATTISATVTVKSGGPPRNRVWDVRVTNPNGSSGVLPGGFTVTP